MCTSYKVCDTYNLVFPGRRTDDDCDDGDGTNGDDDDEADHDNEDNDDTHDNHHTTTIMLMMCSCNW